MRKWDRAFGSTGGTKSTVLSARALVLVLAAAIAVIGGCTDEPEDGQAPPDVPSDVPTGDAEGDVGPGPLSCTTNVQCAGMDGVDACHEGVCDLMTGECALFARPNCCLADAECDDGDDTTTDVCDAAENLCKYTGTTPCQTDLDCDTGEPCVTFACDQVCTTWKKPGCCVEPTDCDDGNSCTVDECSDNACVYTDSTSPLCCGEATWAAAFTGTLDGFEIEDNGQAVRWHLTEERAHSPGGAIRFADPETGTYENPLVDGEVPTSFGRLTTPAVQIPDTEEVTLSFWVWMDLNETEVQYDLVYLEVYSTMGAIPEIWNKGEVAEDEYGTWVQQSVDVSQWRGQEVRFGFVVNTLDGTANNGEGVYIDDVSVTSGCTETPDCTEDSQCDDNNLCTDDRCDAGTCVNEANDGCCQVDSDCPPPPPVACADVQCINNQCEFTTTPGCCTDDSMCDDGDECTADVCDTSIATCSNLQIPDCCQEQTLQTYAFDGNDAQAAFIIEDGVATWKAREGNATSPPASLSFRDENGTYGPDAVSRGTFTSGPITTTGPVRISFNVWMDIDMDPEVDIFELSTTAVPSGVDGEPVWDKNSQAIPPKTWTPVVIDLVASDSWTYQFLFDTVTGENNGGQGVRIDDIRVYTACGDVCDDLDCDDGNPCTIDSCGATGCSHELLDGCGACVEDDDCPDDGNPCTGASCFQGQCLYVPLPDCNPCNSDIDCEDGNPCTENVCNGGECIDVIIPNCEQPCQDVADCDDDNDCTADFCENEACQNVPIPGCGAECTTNSECNDNDACTSDFCVDGKCQSLDIPGCSSCTTNAQCADDDPCTVDSCVAGACQNVEDPDCGGCTTNEQCADGDPCTDDVCAQGACSNPAIPNCTGCETSMDCEDGNPCTNALCIGGQCIGADIPDCCVSASECNDGDPCTADFCEGNTCQHLPIPGCGCTAASCNDGNPCTEDVCTDAGTCEHQTIGGCCLEDAQCDDGNACTQDVCGPNNQCGHADIAGCCTGDAACDDGNSCTTDTCGADGKCVFTTIAGCCTTNANCNDGNSCTTDTCVNGQCQSAPVAGCCSSNAACGDGNPCTVDTCQNGQCINTPTAGQPGCCATAADCEDGDSCTAHSCETGVCKTTAVPDCCAADTDCEDGLACTKNTCVGGSCQSELLEGCCFGNASCTDGIGCTLDSCNNATGQCQYQLLPGCCLSDAACDDGDPCTKDSCASNNYCSHEPIEGCCAADSECGGAGTCQQARCLANQCFVSDVPGCCTSDAGCDDGNSCTTDSCNNGTCSSSAIAGCCQSDAECTSDDACTVGTCSNGVCSFSEDPNCCVAGTYLFASFGSGKAGWSFLGDTEAKWQITSSFFNSGPASLWFGNAATGTYESGQGSSQGSAQTPEFTLPTAVSAVLDFRLWLDVEENPQFDRLSIRVIAAQGETTVWNKSAVPAESYKSWVQVKVNLSQYVGQTIRLAFDFNTGDGIDNDTQGVFIDDMTVKTSCSEVNICSFDDECDDGQACTADQCVAGSCQHTDIPECCTSNAQCNDNYVCTNDVCNANGECVYEAIEGCCQFNGQCNDNNACTLDSCQNNTCVNALVDSPLCCETASDCDDGDSCTVASCQNSQCVYTADPDNPACCEPTQPINASFDDFSAPGISIIGDGGPAGWSIQNKRFFSPPFSMYFGIPGEWSYLTEPPASGQLVTDPISIPVTAAGATLTFRTWLDIDTGNFGGDSFRVLVLSGTTLKQKWSQAQVQSLQQWNQVSVSLSEYAGQTIQVYFAFQAAEQPFGGGEGIYVDNINISTTCP